MATMTADRDNRSDAPRDRYTKVAITLHWLTAVAILYNLASGLLHDELPRWFFVFHISSGLTILALTLVRIGWRLTHKPPRFLPMQGWEAKLAHAVHFLLYAALLLMPLVGWAMISANPPAGSPGAAYAAANPQHEGDMPPAAAGARAQPAATAPKRRSPPMLWGLVRIPMFASIQAEGRTPEGIPGQRETHEQLETLHGIGGWIMLALLFLHVGGALKHQYVDREPELARMGLGRGVRR